MLFAQFILLPMLALAKSSAIPEKREFPLNPDVNPCQNFYDYVCSKALNDFELREDRSTHTFAFSDSSERILEKKKDYFKKLISIKPQNAKETALKNYYVACMDEKASVQDENQEIVRQKDRIEKLKTRDEVWHWLEESYMTSDPSPLQWWPTENLDEPLNNDLGLFSAMKTLPEKSYYTKPEVMQDFRELLIQFFKAIHSPNPEVQAQSVLDYETELAKVSPTPADMRKIFNDRKFITREDLIKQYPALQLNKLLASIPEKTLIRNWVPESLQFINYYLVTAPLDKIRSVLVFNALYHYIDDSRPDFYKLRFEFNRKHFGGPNQRPDRQERCTKKSMSAFNKEIDFILIDQLFPNFPRDKFVTLAESIRESIIKSIEANTWLSKDAKKEALHKLKAVRMQLIAPQTEKEWDFLPNADYDPKRPIQNEKTLNAVLLKKRIKEFLEPNDPNIWHMGPLTVNAQYLHSYNKFVLPVGILQYPFYDPSRPLEENLAAVGTVIGHEIGHSIDDQGSRYDAEGRQIKPWMTEGDLKEFSRKTEQLVTQFNEAGQNGSLTIGENIGDLVGVTASWQAANEDPLFYKDLNRQKNYFEAYARLWCEVKRPKFIETQLKTDAHALGIARANEQMRQQKDFKTAFACKDGDPMTLPKNKIVHIW